jgi:hypothetical protein
MSKRRRASHHSDPFADFAKSVEAQASKTSIAKLVEIDDLIYAPGGVLSDILRHPKREVLVKEAREHAGTGAEIRETLLAIGAREFGIETRDLGKAVPTMLSPMTDPGLAESFYMDDLRHRLRDDHAFILSDADTLSVVELIVRDGNPEAGASRVNVVVGVVPWNYALLIRKTDNIREIFGFKDSDSMWLRGIAYEPHLDETKPFVRTAELPVNPVQADEQFRWLFFDVIHRRLFTPPDLTESKGGKSPPFDSWLGWLGPKYYRS